MSQPAILMLAVLIFAGCAAPERAVALRPVELPSPTAALQHVQPSEAVTPPGPPSAEEALEAKLRVTPPSRDLRVLHERLKGESPSITFTPQPDSLQVGDSRPFWVLDSGKKSYFQVRAVLRYVTPDVYFFVQEGYDYPEGAVREAATTFSSRIVPQLREYFGSEWSPGIDNDPHIYVLNVSVPGSPGYFYSNDEYPRSANVYSNEREIIYVNLRYTSPGAANYFETLAHEFQHMIHWNNDKSEDAWVNEGLSELAIRLVGYTPGSIPSFVSTPDTQLNTWDENSSRALPHYGASYAFFSYLAEHYGGYKTLNELVGVNTHGILGVEEFLRNQDYNLSFEDVFEDWVVANLLDDPDFEGGRYGYKDLDIRINPAKVNRLPHLTSTTVHQYAADYLDLPSTEEGLDIVFTGTAQVRLVPNEPNSGKAQWWSNRGDVMDTTLTRSFDLSRVDRATLKAWLWYDIEKDFDYAYAEVSTDEGQTWTILPGEHTTTLNPNGNSFGSAYTGKSGGGNTPKWIQEEFDLTPYVGKRALIRFEYVTDDANNNDGFVVDDISIPELEYYDDVESDGGWIAEGFVRSDNYLRQNYSLQLVKRGRQISVQPLPLDSEGKGHWQLNGSELSGQQVILVISATAPSTTQNAPYELSIERLPASN